MKLFASKPSLGETVHKAVEKGEVKKLQDLLLDPSTGSVSERRASIEHFNKQGQTPLMVAASYGNLGMVKLLLQAGVDPNKMAAKKSAPGTALHECAVSGRNRVAEMLLDVGADPFIENPKGCTALDMAINRGEAPLIRTFEQRAIFRGWLFIRMKTYKGLLQQWKVRYVTVFQQSKSTPGGHFPSRVVMQVYKNNQAFKPTSFLRVDGARATVEQRNIEGHPHGTLQCTVSLLPGQSQPPGMGLEGDAHSGWRFEVRPACSFAAKEAQRVVAWAYVTSFANAINNPGGSSPMYRRNTIDVSEFGSEFGAAPAHRRHSEGAAQPLSVVVPSVAAAAAVHGRSASVSLLPQQQNLTEARTAAMTDEQLARWLQEKFNRGDKSPTLQRSPSFLSTRLVSDSGEGSSQPPAADGTFGSSEPQQTEAVPQSSAGQEDAPPSAPFLYPVIEDLSMSTFVAVDNNMNAIRGAQPAPEAEGDMDSADMLAPSSLPPIANGMDCPALPPTPEQELPEVPTHTPSADPNYSTRRQDKQSAAFKGKEPMPYSYQPGSISDDDLTQKCVICLENPKDAGFVHGDSVHKCCCRSCALKLKQVKNPRCPLCRGKIQHFLLNFYE